MLSQESNPPSSAETLQGRHKDAEIDLLDLAIIVAKHKTMILGTSLGAALISFVVALLLPNVYTSTALLMPPQGDQSMPSAVLGQLFGGGPSGGGAVATAVGLKNPNDLYVGILQSRSIADRLIERFNLQELYGEQTLVDVRKKLADQTAITAVKNGLISIEVEEKDPQRAADLANAYVEELENLTARLAISDAARRRIYYQKQIDNTKEALGKADHALKEVQEKTGLIKPDGQSAAIFQTIASLRAQIAAKEVQLTAMRTFATDKNPDFARTQEELNGLRRQLAGRERDNKLGGGDILVPTRKIPAVSLELTERWRDVKYFETLYELLAKQLELAKVEEGKNATIIQLVDRAVPSDKRAKPKRVLIVILATLFAALLATFVAFVREAWSRAQLEQPSRVMKLLDFLKI